MPTATLPVRIKCPSTDPQELLLHWMSGHEELGRPFQYELEIYCTQDVAYQKILGHPLTVSLEKNGGVRHYNGIVTRFAKVGGLHHYLVYRAVLSPRLWLLQRSKDVRIFQNKNVKEVLQKVLGEYQVKVKLNLHQTYPPKDYLVQYRESAFDFCSRVMEQEGIYYYFTHTEDEHEMVLSDDPSSHEPIPGYDKVPVWHQGDAQAIGDHITDWQMTMQIRSAKVLLQDHDFRLPKGAMIKGEKSAASEHEGDKLEIYDYRGGHLIDENKDSGNASKNKEHGTQYANVMLEAQRSKLDRVEGEGQVRGLAAGGLFHIDELDIVNTQFLVVSTRHEIRNVELQSDGSLQPAEGDVSQVWFSGIDNTRHYRAEQITPKPVAAGPDTATVVGAGGDEILTDKFGRIRIQFHWDREGGNDDKSTCWVRVSQVWAGAMWGAHFWPRIGHEVVVQYLGGDPDRPLITGSVYNTDNMPPYAMPAGATRSGWKSRSTKGGGPSNFNEIRFEDKKGSEEIYVQAEKDRNMLVKNNETLTVGANRTKDIGIDETVTVGGNRTETVALDETETINQNQSITVALNRTKDVGVDETISIGANETISIGAACATTIGATNTLEVGLAMSVTVGAVLSETIGAEKSVTVGASSSETVGDDKTLTAGGGITEKAGADFNISAGGNVAAKAGKGGSFVAADNLLLKTSKKAIFEAADEIQIKCGSATIGMKKNGDIAIKGKKITIEGSGDVVIKGSKVGINP
jgi:type VI secretion system secreted protein VgrG